jgi:hypothetical protein
MDFAVIVRHDDVEAEVIRDNRRVEVAGPDRGARDRGQDRSEHVDQPFARSPAALGQPGQRRRHRVVEGNQ